MSDAILVVLLVVAALLLIAGVTVGGAVIAVLALAWFGWMRLAGRSG